MVIYPPYAMHVMVCVYDRQTRRIQVQDENISAYSRKDGHQLGQGRDGNIHLQAPSLYSVLCHRDSGAEKRIGPRQGTDKGEGGRTDLKSHQAIG